MLAQTVSTSPSRLMAAFVSMPATTRLRPRASTIGQAVESGSTTSFCSWSLCACSLSECNSITIPFARLPAENVHHGEDNHPDGVHKMPIDRQHVKAFRVGLGHMSAQGEHESESQHDKSHDNVRRVQADQRIESSAKQIGADGKTMLIDE